MWPAQQISMWPQASRPRQPMLLRRHVLDIDSFRRSHYDGQLRTSKRLRVKLLHRVCISLIAPSRDRTCNPITASAAASSAAAGVRVGPKEPWNVQGALVCICRTGANGHVKQHTLHGCWIGFVHVRAPALCMPQLRMGSLPASWLSFAKLYRITAVAQPCMQLPLLCEYIETVL